MTTLILEIREYPSDTVVLTADLTSDGIKDILYQTKSLIERLDHGASNRSGFITFAATALVDKLEKKELRKKLKEGYLEMARRNI